MTSLGDLDNILAELLPIILQYLDNFDLTIVQFVCKGFKPIAKVKKNVFLNEAATRGYTNILEWASTTIVVQIK